MKSSSDLAAGRDVELPETSIIYIYIYKLTKPLSLSLSLIYIYIIYLIRIIGFDLSLSPQQVG
jgi:hypothetical protein